MAKNPARSSNKDRVQAARDHAEQQRIATQKAQRRRANLIKAIIAAIVLVVVAVAVVIIIALKNKGEDQYAEGPYPKTGNEVGGVLFTGPTEAKATNLTGKVKRPEGDNPLPSERVNISGADKNATPVQVIVYADPACPHCYEFEKGWGPTLSQQLEAGKITLEQRMVPYLDRGSPSNYSSRSINMLACVADSKPEAYSAVLNELFEVTMSQGEQKNQELIDLAKKHGVYGNIDSCVTDGTFRPWVAHADCQAREDGVRGTPSVFVNGERWDGKKNPDFGGWLQGKIDAAGKDGEAKGSDAKDDK